MINITDAHYEALYGHNTADQSHSAHKYETLRWQSLYWIFMLKPEALFRTNNSFITDTSKYLIKDLSALRFRGGCLSRVTFWAMTVPSYPSEDRQVNLEDLSASYGAFRDAFQFTTVVKSGYLNNCPLEPVLPFSSNPSQQQGTSACCTVAYWIVFFVCLFLHRSV